MDEGKNRQLIILNCEICRVIAKSRKDNFQVSGENGITRKEGKNEYKMQCKLDK